MESILITGASSGIGREMAISFSGNYLLILSGRNRERLAETLSLCSNRSSHLIWQYDLENIENLEKSLSDFLQTNSIQVNHFVHSAGYLKTYPLKLVSASLLRTTFSINVFSGSLISKTLTNKKNNKNSLRSIVFISSNISNFGAIAHSVYGASKGAVDALMRSLSVELAPNVRVNSVLPGAVRTPLTEQVYQNEELLTRMASLYPLGLGYTEDIYNAVNFLISDSARWITGQQITVDGGRTINITG